MMVVLVVFMFLMTLLLLWAMGLAGQIISDLSLDESSNTEKKSIGYDKEVN